LAWGASSVAWPSPEANPGTMMTTESFQELSQEDIFSPGKIGSGGRTTLSETQQNDQGLWNRRRSSWLCYSHSSLMKGGKQLIVFSYLYKWQHKSQLCFWGAWVKKIAITVVMAHLGL
jgi:hypothetical protein